MPTGNGQPRVYDTTLPSDWTPGNTLYSPLLVDELRADPALAGNQVNNVDTAGATLEVDLDILLYFPNPLTGAEQAAADAVVLAHNGTPPDDENAVKEEVDQVAHGFVVGDVLRYESGAWLKAQADLPENSEALGVVTEVPDADEFTVSLSGRVNVFSGLTPDNVYFLSPTVAGGIQTTDPVFPDVSKPILYALSPTEGIIRIRRGSSGEEVVPNILVKVMVDPIDQIDSTTLKIDEDTNVSATDGLLLSSMMTTLQDAANRVKIEARVSYDMSANNRGARLMIVRDGTIIGIAADQIAEKDVGDYLQIEVWDTPGTVGPHTYEVRAGVETSGGYTLYINQLDGDATPFGTAAPAFRNVSFCQITEFTA
jgi:hypothetical protein